MDKRLSDMSGDLAQAPFAELFDPLSGPKNAVLYSKNNWEKLFLDPNQVDAHYKSILLSQNPLKQAPIWNKENSNLPISTTDSKRCPHFIQEQDSKPPVTRDVRNSKTQRQIQNRQNLIFSKSALKDRNLAGLIKNPIETGFSSRSKSPILSGFKTNKPVSNLKPKKKAEANRWK